MIIDRRRVAVALAGFITFLYLFAPWARLPMLSRQLGVSARDVSFTVSATTFATALIAPYTVAVADVMGRKRVIVTAMIALVVPTVLVAPAGGLEGMVLWRFVQGLFLPPIFVVTIAYVG